MALLPGVSFQWHTPRGLLPGASSQGALPNYILNGTNHDENMSFECERDAQCTFYNDYKRFWTKKHNLRCNCFENTHFGTKKHNFRCKCFENAHFEQKNTNFNANASVSTDHWVLRCSWSACSALPALCWTECFLLLALSWTALVMLFTHALHCYRPVC